ncbi:ABC transporter permease [Paenibacillus cremeus]|uniref:Multidrug transporter n=1 Tax=Paenibacillus cremeus TaxID=2163881 RepID=A0A559K807_9BACL|nr:ABC-2 family transporter protein [Paenibacillus cremeus]TVY08275.1 multidrug transporter [Paenibacillus cremeus]
MSKYVNCFREFLRACLVEELEHRANFAANLMSTVFWLAMAVFTVQLYFFRTPSVGGWSYYEVLALLGVFTAIHGFIEFFLQPNMSRLVTHIRQGTLDYVLTKPIDSQFYVSFRHLVFWRLADVALGLGMIAFALMELGITPNTKSMVLFVLIFASALAVVYSLWMGMMTVSFWAVKVDNLSFLFTSFFETARFPVSVYKGALRFALTYVFPVAFITTYPAAAIVGRLGWTEGAGSLAVAALCLWISRQFWKFALAHYTSASS